MSFTGTGKCFNDSSLTFRAIRPKVFQSGFDSHAGGTAASRQLTKECMSVVVRSDFSYQVVAGRAMSEYRVEVSIRKLRSTTRSIFHSGGFSCQTRSFTAPLATSFAVKLLFGAPSTCFRKNSCPLALAEMAFARQMNQTLGEFPSPSGSSMANRVSPLLSRDTTHARISSSVRAPAAVAASTSRKVLSLKWGEKGSQPSRAALAFM